MNCPTCGQEMPVLFAEEVEPPIVNLPLNDNTEFVVTKKYFTVLEELYPYVDIVRNLREMKAWLIANPKRRKTKNGIKRFINSWLSREQDKPHPPEADDGPRWKNLKTGEEF